MRLHHSAIFGSAASGNATPGFAAERAARRPQRQVRRTGRASARVIPLRRRSAQRPPLRISAEQVDTWLLKGMLVATMAGMLAWFHAPLADLVKGIF